jgi:small-conductance mechanosensitive channel
VPLPDLVRAPALPCRETMAPLRTRRWLSSIITGIVALAALVAGSAFGDAHSKAIDPRLILWISVAVLAVAGTVATTRLSRLLGREASVHAPSVGGAVRIISAAVGYVFVLFAVLAVLEVSISKLLVGAGLAGVVLGIAATQSLGNVFAGIVLIAARPFRVGDHIRIRSGTLGGVFDGWVVEISLTYTTVRLDDGTWKMPNTALLAAGVGQLPRDGPVPPFPQVPGMAAPSSPAAPPAGAPEPDPTADHSPSPSPPPR